MEGTTKETSQALMLLTQTLGKEPGRGCQPLDNEEFARLEKYLDEQGKPLSALVNRGWEQVIAGFPEAQRVQKLLERGFLLSMQANSCQTLSITPVCRHENAYPQRLCALGDAPPVIYCLGSTTQLNNGYTAIMAPRTRDEEVVTYVRKIGKAMGIAQKPLATGTGRTTENALMEEAFSVGIPVLGVMRSSLALAATDRRYRNALIEGKLTLVSAADPSGRQLDRDADALIQALSERTVVIDPGPPPRWRDVEPQQ